MPFWAALLVLLGRYAGGPRESHLGNTPVCAHLPCHWLVISFGEHQTQAQSSEQVSQTSRWVTGLDSDSQFSFGSAFRLGVLALSRSFKHTSSSPPIKLTCTLYLYILQLEKLQPRERKSVAPSCRAAGGGRQAPWAWSAAERR